MTIPTVAAVAVTAGVVAVTTVGAMPAVIATENSTLEVLLDFFLKLATILTPVGLAYMAFKQSKLSKQVTDVKTSAIEMQTATTELTVATTELKTDVSELKVHTNSIKDALVAATDRAASAEGNLQGRAEQKQETKDDAATAALSPTPVVVENEDAIKVQTVRPTPGRAVEPGDKGKA